MKFALILCLCGLLASNNTLHAQPAQGYFTSEARTLADDDHIIVSIKKYNPSDDEIKKAIDPPKNAPMNYLQIPFAVTNASLFNNGFESNLYCLDQSGNVIWTKSLGYSKNSVASPVAVDDQFYYAGEGTKEGGKVQLQKIDRKGNVAWSKTFDSLDNVNDILIADNKVNALVSFDASVKVMNKDKTFSYNVYPIYFFLQLDINTGTVITKQYQMMGNYLSSLGYGDPYISSYQSYYLNKKDSAIFLNTTKQEGAITVSGDLKGSAITDLIAGPSEYHYLTLSKNNGYVLYSDFYGKEKKYTSNLPVKNNNNGMNRTALLQSGDTMISVINSGPDIDVCYTDYSGKSDCSTKKGLLTSCMAGVSLKGNRPYFIIVNGRDKAGMIGKMGVIFY